MWLGDPAGTPTAERLEQLFPFLTVAQAQALREQLRVAIAGTLRDLVGADHADTHEGAVAPRNP